MTARLPLSVAHLYRPGDPRGLAGSPGAAPDGRRSVKIKQVAFGLSIATAALAGALLIVIGPVEPSMNRQYIGRVFAIVVLGGMGSIGGTLVAALILGVAESFVATFYGPSWAPGWPSASC